MPFGSIGGPSPAISLLKARLAQLDIACDVLYASLSFAAVISASTYDRLADRIRDVCLSGEWVFARCLFGDDQARDDAYLQEVASALTDEDREALVRARGAAGHFLADLLRSTSWHEYDLVGFTSSWGQSTSSLALAAEVKHRHRSVRIAFGGANWQGEMGVALLELFPFVDIAFLGEADDSLPAVLERLDEGASLADVPGIAYRDGSTLCVTEAAIPVRQLDALPPPDFGDFFAALGSLPDAPDREHLHLWLQGSRGCWWAARRGCRFCGLNGPTRGYRAKSSQRILEDIRVAVADWPGCRINLVDTVVPPSFLDEVLPALLTEGPRVELWFETRPEIKHEQVRTIAAAGGEIQIGIESLSEHVLELMCKGSRALEGLRLLKWCQAEGVKYGWNIIYDIPGETDEDYEEMIAMIPSLLSLRPPALCIPMSLDRFSAYHDSAATYGISDVRAPDAWRFVYPWPQEVLERTAYTFHYRKERDLVRAALVRRLGMEVAEWQRQAGRVDLSFVAGRPACIEERRCGELLRRVDLDDLEAALYGACGDIASEEDLIRLAGALLADQGDARAAEDAPRHVRERLGRLVGERVMVASGLRYLSMAIGTSSGCKQTQAVRML